MRNIIVIMLFSFVLIGCTSEQKNTNPVNSENSNQKLVVNSLNKDFSINASTIVNGTWYSEQIDGSCIASLSATAVGNNSIALFRQGTDNHCWYKTKNGSSPWTGWMDLGGIISANPGSCSWAANRIDVFVRGTDNRLHSKAWSQDQWTDWYLPVANGVLASAPSSVSWGYNRIDVFVRGTDNGLHTVAWDGSRWVGWMNLGEAGNLSLDPTCTSWGSGRIDLFSRGRFNNLWHKYYDGSWSNWENIGSNPASSPAAVSLSTRVLEVFFKGSDNLLYEKYVDYNVSSAWSQIRVNCPISNIKSAPSATCMNNEIHLFFVDMNNTIWHVWRVSNI